MERPMLFPNANYEPSRELNPDQLELFPENQMREMDEVKRNAQPDDIVISHQTAREFMRDVQFVDLLTGMGQYESYPVTLRQDQLVEVRKLIAMYVASDLEAKAKALRGDG